MLLLKHSIQLLDFGMKVTVKMVSQKSIKAKMTFMVDDPLLASHKSYEILYDTQDMPIGCNFDYVKQEVIVEDFRALKGDLSMDRDGFLLEDLEASMTYEDFFNEDVLKERYVSDVKRTIQELCGARAVYIHECVVSVASTEYMA